jgi:16S rRNA (guanine966-N2)-methyltransferase
VSKVLRVIAGTAKGMRLHSLPGMGTRPPTARVRAAFFNIVQPIVEGASFLDLFAGTGSYSVEALSRGARQATLVELNPKQIEVIQENLRRTGFAAQACVVRGDVLRILGGHGLAEARFDLVIAAPPHLQDLCRKTLSCLASLGEKAPLAPGATIFVQHHRDDPLPERMGPLVMVRRYAYGITVLTRYTWA